MSNVFNYIEVQQPIGTFYLCSIPAPFLLKVVKSTSRSDDPKAVQREKSPGRIKDIGAYCSDPDAVFPTPIVVSVSSSDVRLDEEKHLVVIPEDKGIIGNVIDGQHRLWGIECSEHSENFQLPVVLMFDLTVAEEAYIFSTINSNQRKVDPSLIYDLFDVSAYRSPQKTAHEIARVMNSSSSSPFYNRLKMLGKKTADQEMATLSQGTFAKSILMLISKKPDVDARKLKNGQKLDDDGKMPLRCFFVQQKDELLVRIFSNCFNALKEAFPSEWDNPNDNILWKSTGFRAVMYALPNICRKGIREKVLTKDFFVGCFTTFKDKLTKENITLTSKSFPGGGEQNQKKLANLIIQSVANLDLADYNSHLERLPNIQAFISSIDADKYELFDIAQALDKGTVAYDTIVIKPMNDGVELIHCFSDISISVQENQRKPYLKFIEKHYMNDMDYNSWIGFEDVLQSK